ncbi:MAG: hypothetical protein P8X98_16205, partial [Woeseiaceae bacterium]
AKAMTEVVVRVNDFGKSLAAAVAAPVLGTITCAELGRIATGRNFGMSPGDAIVMGVLRAQTSEDLDYVRAQLIRLVTEVAAGEGLESKLS